MRKSSVNEIFLLHVPFFPNTKTCRPATGPPTVRRQVVFNLDTMADKVTARCIDDRLSGYFTIRIGDQSQLIWIIEYQLYCLYAGHKSLYIANSQILRLSALSLPNNELYGRCISNVTLSSSWTSYWVFHLLRTQPH